ncbi:hypothetical protein ACSBR2_020809 [Camellia fascicularis]
MALVPAPATDRPLFAEVDMGGSDSSPTVRATVVQASTVFYDTPATLGSLDSFYFEFIRVISLGFSNLEFHNDFSSVFYTKHRRLCVCLIALREM